MKEQFPVLAEQCSFDEPERWIRCSSHSERKLSNEELMQTPKECRLATRDLEKDCYI